jgi:hypothetical protein
MAHLALREILAPLDHGVQKEMETLDLVDLREMLDL